MSFKFEPRQNSGRLRPDLYGWWNNAIGSTASQGDTSDVGPELFEKLSGYDSYSAKHVKYYPSRQAAIAALRNVLEQYEPHGFCDQFWWWDRPLLRTGELKSIPINSCLPTALFNLLPSTRYHTGKVYATAAEATKGLLSLVGEAEPEIAVGDEIQFVPGSSCIPLCQTGWLRVTEIRDYCIRVQGVGDWAEQEWSVHPDDVTAHRTQNDIRDTAESGDTIRIPSSRRGRANIPEREGDLFVITGKGKPDGKGWRCTSVKTGNPQGSWHNNANPIDPKKPENSVTILEVIKPPEDPDVTVEWLVSEKGWTASYTSVYAHRRVPSTIGAYLVWSEHDGIQYGSLGDPAPLPFPLVKQSDYPKIAELFQLGGGK